MLSLQIRHVLYLKVEKFFFKITQFYRTNQLLKSFVGQNLLGYRFFLDYRLDSAKPLGRFGIIILGGSRIFKFKEFFDFDENFLNFREKFLAMAHFIYMMNVFRGLFGEHFKIQKADEVNLRKFILFILVDLIFDHP